MYVHVYVCKHICTHIYTHTHLYPYLHKYKFVHIYIGITILPVGPFSKVLQIVFTPPAQPITLLCNEDNTAFHSIRIGTSMVAFEPSVFSTKDMAFINKVRRTVSHAIAGTLESSSDVPAKSRGAGNGGVGAGISFPYVFVSFANSFGHVAPRQRLFCKFQFFANSSQRLFCKFLFCKFLFCKFLFCKFLFCKFLLACRAKSL